MLIKIDIENEEPITRNKRDGSGTYQVQEAWAHLYGINGLHPHPQRIELFPPKDDQGYVRPYAKGEYALAPDSVGIRFGKLSVFTKLIPYVEALHVMKEVLVSAKQKAA